MSDAKEVFLKHIEWSRSQFENYWLINYGNDVSEYWDNDKRIYIHDSVNLAYKSWKGCFAIDLFRIDEQEETILKHQATIDRMTVERNTLLEIANTYSSIIQRGSPSCQKNVVDICKCTNCVSDRLDALIAEIEAKNECSMV